MFRIKLSKQEKTYTLKSIRYGQKELRAADKGE